MEHIQIIEPVKINFKYINEKICNDEHFLYFKPGNRLEFGNLNKLSIKYKDKIYDIDLTSEPNKIIVPSKKSKGRRTLSEYTQILPDITAGVASVRVDGKKKKLKNIVIKYLNRELKD